MWWTTGYFFPLGHYRCVFPDCLPNVPPPAYNCLTIFSGSYWLVWYFDYQVRYIGMYIWEGHWNGIFFWDVDTSKTVHTTFVLTIGYKGVDGVGCRMSTCRDGFQGLNWGYDCSIQTVRRDLVYFYLVNINVQPFLRCPINAIANAVPLLHAEWGKSCFIGREGQSATWASESQGTLCNSLI